MLSDNIIWYNVNVIEQVTCNKSSLKMKNLLKDTKTLQLFTKIILAEINYESN